MGPGCLFRHGVGTIALHHFIVVPKHPWKTTLTSCKEGVGERISGTEGQRRETLAKGHRAGRWQSRAGFELVLAGLTGRGPPPVQSSPP